MTAERQADALRAAVAGGFRALRRFALGHPGSRSGDGAPRPSAAATCPLCGDLRPSPLEESREGGRYCAICREAVSIESWTPQARLAQARLAQAESAQWAREVLGDPRTLLMVVERTNWSVARVRSETVGGDVLIDTKVRLFDDPLAGQNGPTFTTRGSRDWSRCYEGTLGPSDFEPHSVRIAASRPIMWHAHGIPGMWPIPAKLPAEADGLSRRLTLWQGQIPYRSTYPYAEPLIPVLHGVNHSSAEQQRQGDDDLATEVEMLRCLLLLMAFTQPPEPGGLRPHGSNTAA